MSKLFRQLSTWIVIAFVGIMFLMLFQSRTPQLEEVEYSRVLVDGQNGQIRKITIIKQDDAYKGEAEYVDGTIVKFEKVNLPDDFTERWIKLGVDVSEKHVSRSLLFGLLINVIPLLLIIGVFYFFMYRQMQAGGNKAMSFGKSRARLHAQGEKPVTFEDVAGVDEAKEELQEVIDFLTDPKKFTRLGGKIPKGVLLVGPPGSGKTLLAKAVAGEAKVPFFTISGSDFVEMFVGVGASRVRDLFYQGQKNAPCIIFIDEIDAVGRQRGAGLGGGHDEREQTLNQLLVEMDGFNSNEGVILMAATNRPDILDKALLRPGRFDRQIVVDNPDKNGREGIIRVHIKEIPLSDDVDISVLARGTPGFSGADLANMINEAALLAARRDRDRVTSKDFDEAKDRVMMGLERRSLFISDEEKTMTAYHEAGHTLVGWYLPDMDPVHKVTIIPRGRALGLTSYLPLEDRHTYSRTYLVNRISCLMGGRAAENIVFSEMTNGAGSDLKIATDIAHRMVCEWGMSDKLGPIAFGSNEEIFLGRDFIKERSYSEEVAAEIDREIRRIVDESHQQATAILTEHKAVLDAIAIALVEREVLEYADLEEIIDGIEQPDGAPASGQKTAGEKRTAALARSDEVVAKRSRSRYASYPIQSAYPGNGYSQRYARLIFRRRPVRFCACRSCAGGRDARARGRYRRYRGRVVSPGRRGGRAG